MSEWCGMFRCSECEHMGRHDRICCPKCDSKMWGHVIVRWVSKAVWYKPWTWLSGEWEERR
jgi:hypothetical protein